MDLTMPELMDPQYLWGNPVTVDAPCEAEMDGDILLPMMTRKIEQIRDTWQKEVVSTMKEMVSQNRDRLSRALDKRDLKALKRGVFSGPEIADALKKQVFDFRFKGDVEKEKAALEMFHKHYFEMNFYNGYLACEGVELIAGCVNGFILKSGSPSEVLKKIVKGPSILDSHCVCQIAYYRALLKILGREKFDYLCAADGPTPLVINGKDIRYDEVSVISRLISEKDFEENKDLGDLVRIQNMDDFREKHLDSDYYAYSVMYIGENEEEEEVFTGLGISPEGKRMGEIDQFLLEEYNKKPLPPLELSFINRGTKEWERMKDDLKHLRESGLEDKTRTLDEFEDLHGGWVDATLAPNMEKIYRLAMASIKGAGELIDQWIRLDDTEQSQARSRNVKRKDPVGKGGGF